MFMIRSQREKTTRLTDEISTGLTLSLALGRITALATCGFLQVIGFGAAAAAQCVRLIATLSKRRRTLRLDRRKTATDQLNIVTGGPSYRTPIKLPSIFFLAP